MPGTQVRTSPISGRGRGGVASPGKKSQASYQPELLRKGPAHMASLQRGPRQAPGEVCVTLASSATAALCCPLPRAGEMLASFLSQR